MFLVVGQGNDYPFPPSLTPHPIADFYVLFTIMDLKKYLYPSTMSSLKYENTHEIWYWNNISLLFKDKLCLDSSIYAHKHYTLTHYVGVELVIIIWLLGFVCYLNILWIYLERRTNLNMLRSVERDKLRLNLLCIERLWDIFRTEYWLIGFSDQPWILTCLPVINQRLITCYPPVCGCIAVFRSIRTYHFIVSSYGYIDTLRSTWIMLFLYKVSSL